MHDNGEDTSCCLSERVHVFRDGLDPETQDIKWLKVVARALADKPNYWIPKECIGSEKITDMNKDGNLRELAEGAVDVLFKRCVEPLLVQEEAETGEWAGAEYWAQVYTGGRGLEFHFDKDEHAMKTRGEMRTPILSSVLYCTGATSACAAADGGEKSWRDVLQSPTIVTDQHFDEEQGVTVPSSPTSSTMVFPKENRYCVFGGSYGHGVLDSGNEDERITFLVNWWRQKPETIERCPESETIVLNTAGMQEAMESLDLEENDGTGERRTNHTKLHETCLKDKETKLHRQQEEDIVVIQAGAEDFEYPMIVDDLLALHGIHLSGNDSPAAVTVEHKGLMLCPIEVVKDSNEIIHVCGAFLKEE